MSEAKPFNELNLLEKKTHPAVQSHINVLQEIINRMSQNSARCKSWVIPIVSALLALSSEKGIVPTATLYTPIVMFYLLDCFYLGHERRFRDKQRDFVLKINKGDDISEDVFLLNKNKNKNRSLLSRRLESLKYQLLCTIDGMFSFSTTIVYGALVFAVNLMGR